ncbi:MAG: signal peptidase II [Candidatus Poriferisodalaceae bacterium]|jgi:signal peptidase II|tara:strand:- start:5349 stop:5867 length:519 start_codon:yes stop_codon:yes gene_type:complete
MKVSSIKRRKTFILFNVSSVLLALDQLTKSLALSRLGDGPVEIFWTLRFFLASNTGFAFGTAEGYGPWVGAVALVIAGMLIRMKNQIEVTGGLISLGLILGGALGNLADRMFRGAGWGRGAVVDFIDLQFWPIFNLADAGIVIGVGSLVYYLWKQEKIGLKIKSSGTRNSDA